MTWPYRILAAPLLSATLTVLLAPPAAAYEPVLPRMPEPERIVILDFMAERAQNGRTPLAETVVAVGCLQGLVNRHTTEKLWVKNQPVRIFWKPEKATGGDGNASHPGPGNPYQHMLDDGMLPYPRSDAELNVESKHPVLSWLLEHHAETLEGLVLYDFSFQDTGSMAAAINACTFDSLLPVTTDLRDWLRSEGIDLPVVEDVTGLDALAAHDWSLSRYVAAPERTDAMLGFVRNPVAMTDYFVAAHVFSYYLGIDDVPGDASADERQEVETRNAAMLLALEELVAHYPQGATSFGGTEGAHLNQPLAALGHPNVNGLIPNASLTSGIPTDPETFRPAPDPWAREPDPDGAYLCFSGNDGDAMDFGYAIQYKNLRNDPERDRVPMAWKINPYFIDLFPTFYAWHTHQQSSTVDLAFSMNDGGHSDTKAGKQDWKRQFGSYFSIASEATPIVHTMGVYTGGRATELQRRVMSFDPLYLFVGYNGPNPPTAGIDAMEGPVLSGLVGHASITPTETADQIVTALASVPVGEPAFIMVRLGIDEERLLNARRGTIPFSMGKEVMDALASDARVARNLHYVPARDLAATYLHWQGKWDGPVGEPPQVEPEDQPDLTPGEDAIGGDGASGSGGAAARDAGGSAGAAAEDDTAGDDTARGDAAGAKDSTGTSAGSDDGCGCRLAGNDTGGGGLAALLLALLIGRRRR